METRIKTSQLTYLLLCHLEETSVITQHADSLIALFFHGVKDTEATVVKNVSTVWTFQNFCVIQNLCEINFGESRSSKTAVLAIFWALKFC